MTVVTQAAIAVLVVAHGVLVWRLEQHRRRMTDELRATRRAVRLHLADPIRGK